MYKWEESEGGSEFLLEGSAGLKDSLGAGHKYNELQLIAGAEIEGIRIQNPYIF